MMTWITDEYGVVESGPGTVDAIVAELRESGSVVIGWTDGRMTLLNVLFTYDPVREGPPARIDNGPDKLFVSVLGRGAQVAGGIVYLRRDSGKSRSAVLKVIADTILESGFPVLIFPEGTTSVQQGTLPFKPGTFRLAAQSGIPVAPVALVFDNRADYWGDGEGFVAHIKRQFGHHRIRVRVSYGPLLRHTDGDELCRQAQAWVEKEIERLG